MALNCRVNINSKGEVTSINAPNGAVSKLYTNLKKILGDKAKQVYAITETEGFKKFTENLKFAAQRPQTTPPEDQQKQTAKLVTEYLKSKGQNINILSEEAMLEEVRKRGYDSFEAMVKSWRGINEYEVYDDRELSDTITLEFNEGSVTIGDVFELYDFLEDYESEFSNPDSFFEIQDLQIKPEFQGQGKGRELLKDTIEYIQKNFGNKDIYLNASPIGNRALSAQELSDFYATEGFKVLEDEGSNVTMVRKGRNSNIQFLNQGDQIYGFYDTNTGEIYLTEELLSSENLVHELFHSFRPILKQKAEQGDKTSQSVLKELEKLSIELLGGEQAVKGKFEQETQKETGLTFSVQNSWFSNSLKGISKITQKNATPEQWVKMIADRGGKGTTQELEWIGLQDYLKDWKKENKAKSVPKEVVEQYINDNKIEIVEVTKGAIVINEKRKLQAERKIINEGYIIEPDIETGEVYLIEEDTEFEPTFEELSPKLKELVDEYNSTTTVGFYGHKSDSTKYSDYQLEGGENYREVLLTLPQKKTANQYKSSHWDEANILAHLRLNERTLPNGERVLFMEEVQSDWAQEGKKKGFASENIKDKAQKEWEELKVKADKLRSEGKEFPPEMKARGKELAGIMNNPKLKSGVPNMPYKKTDQWVGMAMRRVMQMAAQEGFDRVTWVTGEQSADRYDLSKSISKVRLVNMKAKYPNVSEGKPYAIIAYDKEGYAVVDERINKEEAENYVGKEVAKKLEEDSSRVDEFENMIENQDLKVGGEGMKTFYNSILPKVAKKEAQRFDKQAKVEVVEIDIPNEFNQEDENLLSEIEDRESDNISQSSVKSKQLSIEITPKMRETFSEGIPLFMTNQLSSEVYNPREGESYEQYRDRMVEEASAILLQKNSVQYFERIAKENGLNETETKSFIQRIKDFIKDFGNWLTQQLGLENTSPEEIANLTQRELFDRITTSMLNQSQENKKIDPYYISEKLISDKGLTMKAVIEAFGGLKVLFEKYNKMTKSNIELTGNFVNKNNVEVEESTKDGDDIYYLLKIKNSDYILADEYFDKSIKKEEVKEELWYMAEQSGYKNTPILKNNGKITADPSFLEDIEGQIFLQFAEKDLIQNNFFDTFYKLAKIFKDFDSLSEYANYSITQEPLEDKMQLTKIDKENKKIIFNKYYGLFNKVVDDFVLNSAKDMIGMDSPLGGGIETLDVSGLFGGNMSFIYDILDNINKKEFGQPIDFKPGYLKNVLSKNAEKNIQLEYNSKGQHLAPNGKPSNLTEAQAKQVRTKAFKDWFGDWENDPQNASKVVDENGEPMVMYHSTKSNEFFEFDPNKIGTGAGINYGKGYYFESRKDEAKWYTGGEGRVMEVFLNSKTPENYYGMTKDQRERADGISDNLNEEDVFEGGQFMVKNPNQIKSATDNIGTFDPNNNDIRFSVPKVQEMTFGDTVIKYTKAGNKVNLEEIQTPQELRGKGSARKALKQFLAVTDKKNLIVKLVVAPRDKSTSEPKLKEFYQSEGFEFDSMYGFPSDFEMIRYPQGTQQEVVEELYKAPQPEYFDENGEAKVEVLAKYATNKNVELNQEEKTIVQNMAMIFGVTTSEGLQKKLEQNFVNRGFIVFDKNRMQDLTEQEKNYVIENSEQIERLILGANSVELQDYNPTFVFRGSEPFSIDNPYLVEQEIKEAVAGAENPRQMLSEGYVSVYDTNPSFKEAVDTLAKENVKVKVFKATEETLTEKPQTNTEELLTETVNFSNTNKLNAQLTKLLSYSEAALRTNEDSLYDLAKDIENQAVNAGIDLEGLAENTVSKSFDDTINYLSSLKDYLDQAGATTKSFAKTHNQYFGIESAPRQEVIRTEDVNDVIVETELSEETLYEKYGLIRSKGSQFKNVKQEPLDILYTKFYTNDIKLNKDFEDIDDLKEYVQDQVGENETAEAIFLFKQYFGIKDTQNRPQVENKINSFDGDFEYLSTNFISDFYINMLKNKDDVFYSNFKITNKGIELKNNDPLTVQDVVDNIPESIKKVFTNYNLISQNLNLPLQTEVNPSKDISNLQVKRIEAVVNTESLPKVDNYQREGNVIVTATNPNNFVKVKDEAYEIVKEIGDRNIYVKIPKTKKGFLPLSLYQAKPKENVDLQELNYLVNKPTEYVTKENIYSAQELNKINQENFNC